MTKVTAMPMDEVLPGDIVIIHGKRYEVRWIVGPDTHGWFDLRIINAQQPAALEAFTACGRLDVVHD
jgi:hypothetical protein